MSTFALSEPVHVSTGRGDFDFPAGTVTAASPDEERVLRHLTEVTKGSTPLATLTADVAPVAPVPPAPEVPPVTPEAPSAPAATEGNA